MLAGLLWSLVWASQADPYLKHLACTLLHTSSLEVSRELLLQVTLAENSTFLLPDIEQ